MVTIDPSSRPVRRTLGAISRKLVVLMGAVAGGIFLQTLVLSPSDDGRYETLIAAPTYYTPGLRQASFGPQCRYYLAESAIANGGLGLFTAVGITNGEKLGIPDICIYVADTPEGTDFLTHSWARDVFFGEFEGNNPRAACEGFATLFNSLPAGVQNSKLNSPRVQTNGGLDRHTYAGAGAITHYFGIQSSATDTIAAGEELTIDYGDFPYKEDEVYTKPVRPVEWLHEFGMCIDNIVVGPAVDPKMGRGAFATRFLPADSAVAPAPLQTFRNRSDFAQQEPESVFVNYNFQPAGTKMMLFPYGPGVNLINHSREKANVKLRWSTSKFHKANLLTMNADEFWKNVYPGALILDVVALRDIRQGEELFMDYGDEWSEAWDAHVGAWKPAKDEYVYPAEMDETAPLLTVDEQKKHPYPENLGTICNTPDWDRTQSKKIEWYEPSWDFPEGFLPCHILDRKRGMHGEDRYKVLINFDGGFKKMNYRTPADKRYIDTNVPRRAIRFVDQPYQSDQHLKTAFRHPIRFPDLLVPDQWKQDF